MNLKERLENSILEKNRLLAEKGKSGTTTDYVRKNFDIIQSHIHICQTTGIGKAYEELSDEFFKDGITKQDGSPLGPKQVGELIKRIRKEKGLSRSTKKIEPVIEKSVVVQKPVVDKPVIKPSVAAAVVPGAVPGGVVSTNQNKAVVVPSSEFVVKSGDELLAEGWNFVKIQQICTDFMKVKLSEESWNQYYEDFYNFLLCLGSIEDYNDYSNIKPLRKQQLTSFIDLGQVYDLLIRIKKKK